MNTAIILAAGSGSRMQSKINKILINLDDKPALAHSIQAFELAPSVDNILIVSSKENLEDVNDLLELSHFKKVSKVIVGGEERQDSVYNGIKELKNSKEEDIVLVHNAANPFVEAEEIEEIITQAKVSGAAALAVRARDTIKETDEENVVQKTIPRKNLWQMQTPQAAQYSILAKAFVNACNDNYYGTDDVELIERLGQKVRIVESTDKNFKLTTPNDLEKAKLLLNSVKVGLGQDSHRFTNVKKPLIMGGIEIPDEPGMDANSDGDVIFHALFNALSQAVGGKSLGFYADELCEKGVKDSIHYLKIALEMVKEKGYSINNIGIMIEAQHPRLGKYDELIKDNIAQVCGLDVQNIGLTATSGEKLTEFGKGEGIQAFCIVALGKNGS